VASGCGTTTGFQQQVTAMKFSIAAVVLIFASTPTIAGIEKTVPYETEPGAKPQSTWNHLLREPFVRTIFPSGRNNADRDIKEIHCWLQDHSVLFCDVWKDSEALPSHRIFIPNEEDWRAY
jgi:hypothetical protein